MPSPALSPASSLALSRARPASAAPEALGGGAVWRADELARNTGATRPTGHAALDAVLPGGGWPVGALVEVLQPQAGQGEWRLLAPALAAGAEPGRPGGALVLAWVWLGLFSVNMVLKEASMSRYPEWAAYKKRSWWLIPGLL